MQTSKKIWLIILSALILLTLVAGGGGFMLLQWGNTQVEAAAPAETQEEAVVVTGVAAEPPQNIRAFYITANDFYGDQAATKEQVTEKLTGIFQKAKELGFNTLVMDTKLEDSFVYQGTESSTTVDALSLALNMGKEQEINVYPVY